MLAESRECHLFGHTRQGSHGFWSTITGDCTAPLLLVIRPMLRGVGPDTGSGTDRTGVTAAVRENLRAGTGKDTRAGDGGNGVRASS